MGLWFRYGIVPEDYSEINKPSLQDKNLRLENSDAINNSYCG
ncbi:hypothetical protein MARI151_60113 [Maribacter litoralis]|uniref:Uncharacterized protein n=1 Tax=Maribacter litoralis TaxID=2059726 RepID=A0A653W2J0_9FLAO|nr:hypothetical protein MARI151_60113 [Maribacter litoralis]